MLPTYEELEKELFILKTQKSIADIADAKLLQEGRVVFCEKNRSGYSRDWNENRRDGDTHKAILIKIEPISMLEKDGPIEKCLHPKEKISSIINLLRSCIEHICECGARVVPKEFEEVN